MIERVDSEIRTDFVAHKFTFTTNRDILFKSVKFQSIQVNNFSNISLYPLPAEKNDPNFESVEEITKMVIIPEENEDYASVQVKNVNDEHCG